MKFKELWKESETGDWILQFEGEEEEIDILRSIEEETYMTISELVALWLNWMIKNPKEGMSLIRQWEKSCED